MAYNSSIKSKFGKCKHCSCREKDQLLIAGLCENHYWQSRQKAKAPKQGGNIIRPKSDKKKAIDEVYKTLRKQFLHDHPKCGARLKGCTINATEVHHKAGRGKEMLNTTKWLSICQTCHIWITENSAQAIELGLSERRNGPIN